MRQRIKIAGGLFWSKEMMLFLASAYILLLSIINVRLNMHAFIIHNQSLQSALIAQISALVWSGNLNARLSSAALTLIADAASGSDGIFLKKKCRHTTATHSFFVSASFVSGRANAIILL
jgi:hypothetical protein